MSTRASVHQKPGSQKAGEALLLLKEKQRISPCALHILSVLITIFPFGTDFSPNLELFRFCHTFFFGWFCLWPLVLQHFANISSVFLEEYCIPQCFCWPQVTRYGSNRHPKNQVILRGRKKKHYAFYISFNIQNVLGYTGVFGLKVSIHTEQKVSFLQCPRYSQSGGSLKSTSLPSIFWEFPTPSCPLLLLAGGHCLNLGELHPPAVNNV